MVQKYEKIKWTKIDEEVTTYQHIGHCYGVWRIIRVGDKKWKVYTTDYYNVNWVDTGIVESTLTTAKRRAECEIVRKALQRN